MDKTGITPTRKENYAEWYQQVIRAADLAENAPVRGCMIIKPNGYQLWETLQHKFDQAFKATGHVNAYFPLFIPVRFLQKEAEHVAGFAKECAVVTHSRLQANEQGVLEPASPLEEPLIVRPTSETIIGEAFSRWVQSYRDLPLLINQWANVVRWEMRTRLFLRTSEFLWQEGHTAHSTAEEARQETLQMLEIYRRIIEEDLAIPAVVGEKTASERFPGALATYTLEGMMQDRKALQLGTSHFLGQNFAKAMNIQFVDVDGKSQYAWTTSWGVTTRLIGALVMVHSDDNGLVLPPKVANVQAVIMPIVHDEAQRGQIEAYCDQLQRQLQANDLRISVDKRAMRGGEKRWQWIKRGACCLVEIGMKEMESQSVTLSWRDTLQKENLSLTQCVATFADGLKAMQQRLFERAKSTREAATQRISSVADF
ncbi:MAG: proline--tRNA ligase, partial [Opitutales bacterium]|nr:proline--tRNA ligase [Opitutales bacterium]